MILEKWPGGKKLLGIMIGSEKRIIQLVVAIMVIIALFLAFEFFPKLYRRQFMAGTELMIARLEEADREIEPIRHCCVNDKKSRAASKPHHTASHVVWVQSRLAASVGI